MLDRKPLVGQGQETYFWIERSMGKKRRKLSLNSTADMLKALLMPIAVAHSRRQLVGGGGGVARRMFPEPQHSSEYFASLEQLVQ